MYNFTVRQPCPTHQAAKYTGTSAAVFSFCCRRRLCWFLPPVPFVQSSINFLSCADRCSQLLRTTRETKKKREMLAGKGNKKQEKSVMVLGFSLFL